MGLTQITTGGVDDNINIDSNTLKVDGTNNRVGIGTASPGKDLEVYNTTGPSISLNDGGQYKSYFTLLGNDLEIRGSNGNIELYTGSADGASSTERFRIDSSGNAQVSTGQFTVGTTASTGLQFINDGTFGTINSADLVFRTNATERLRLDTSGNLILKTTASAGEFVFREGGTNAWSIDTNGANGYLRFFDKYNNSERLRIANNGKVGIGLSAPGALLHVRSSDAQIKVSKGIGGGAAPSSPSRANCYIHVGGTEWGSTANNGHYLIGFGYTNGETGTGIPAYIGYRESSTGSYTQGDLIFGTRNNTTGTNNPTERVRISSDGVLGINKSSGYTSGGFASPQLAIKQTATDWTGGIHLESQGSSKLGCIANTEDGLEISQSYRTSNDGGAYRSIIFRTSGTERMRINNNGGTVISNNTSSFGTTGWYGTVVSGNVGAISISRNGSNVMAFFHTSNANGINGSPVGTISISTTATSYNTSSDYRLKENVVDLDGAIARVKQLAPKRFNFIADDTTTVDGFLAHEAQTVVPEAVTGTHNQVQVWDESEELPEGVSAGDNKLDEDGNTIPEYQGIDQSKLVPLLTAALQEAIAKIETLETKVAALEAAE